jgi:serine/threonine protein kinase
MQTSDGKRWIVQVISKEEILGLDNRYSRCFERYRNIISMKKNHALENIQKVDFGEWVMLIFEYCNNLTLYDYKRSLGRPFSVQEICSLMKTVTQFFLSFEQDGGIMHRDLKLENIYVHNNEFKVGGLDLSVVGSAESNEVCGSAHYMAPEILCGSSNRLESLGYNRKCDIYSLAIILLELLMPDIKPLPASTDREDSAQEETNIFSLLTSQLHTNPTIITNTLNYISPNLPEWLFGLLHSMLSTSPKDRPNWNYLYLYFTDSTELIPDRNPLQTKLDTLGDPNVLKVLRIRDGYFHRVDHEYKVIQFILYSSQEIWKLSKHDFGDERVFDEDFRQTVREVSDIFLAKAAIYLVNLREAIVEGANIFNIKNFELYRQHATYEEDSRHHLRIIRGEPIETIRELLLRQQTVGDGFIDDKNKQNFFYQESIKMERNKSKDFLDQYVSAKSVQRLQTLPCWYFLENLFSDFLLLIEDCLDDTNRFDFSQHGAPGPFDWNGFLGRRHPQMKKTYVFFSTLPRDLLAK